MSLRETIKAAKLEAQEAGGIFSGKEEKDTTKTVVGQDTDGFSKRSAARAKPASTAASSVRVLSSEDAKKGRSGKKRSEMTKEERKAEDTAMRNREDMARAAGKYLLDQDEQYQRYQRIWWILMGIGVVLAVCCLFINAVIRSGVPYAETLAYIEMAMIPVAYVSIIAAFIFDLWKSSPIRKRVDMEVKGMTRKRLEAVIREGKKAEAEKKAKKGAK